MKLVNAMEVQANDLMLKGADKTTIRLLIGPEDAFHFLMLMLEIAPGGNTPDHNHEWEEEIFIASGQGKLKTEQGEKNLRTGDALFIDPNMVHQFINTGKEPLRFICVIPKR